MSMGIYLPNMETPKNGSCIQIVIDDDGKVYPSVEKCILKMGSIAKAVPVPPHEDLIGRDALRAEVKKYATPSDAWVFSLIRTASTIIPAEPAEE